MEWFPFCLGARIGRYIIASTTAKYNEPENIFSVPCDLVFPCSATNQIDATTATMLADMGCQGQSRWITIFAALPPSRVRHVFNRAV